MRDYHLCNQWRITDGLRNGRGTTHEQLIINIPHPMGIIVPPRTIQCSRHTRKLLESSQNTWVILAKLCSQENPYKIVNIVPEYVH